MPRVARSRKSADVHHVVNRGARRQPIFSDDKDRAAFIGILGDALGEFEVTCSALCLMGNHYHLLINASVEVLGGVMQRVSARYTMRFNQKHEFDGPLFKGRFFSGPIRDDVYLARCIRYIYRNPIDIASGLDLSAYRWSTFRHHLGLAPCPEWIDLEPGLRVCGNNRSELRQFVLDESGGVPEASELKAWFERHDLSQVVARDLGVVLASDVGWSDQEISQSLGIASRSTVRYYRKRGRAEADLSGNLAALMSACAEDYLLSTGVAQIGPKWLRAEQDVQRGLARERQPESRRTEVL